MISSAEDPPRVLTVTFAMPLSLVWPGTGPGVPTTSTSTFTFTAGVWSGFVTYIFYKTQVKQEWSLLIQLIQLFFSSYTPSGFQLSSQCFIPRRRRAFQVWRSVVFFGSVWCTVTSQSECLSFLLPPFHCLKHTNDKHLTYNHTHGCKHVHTDVQYLLSLTTFC